MKDIAVSMRAIPWPCSSRRWKMSIRDCRVFSAFFSSISAWVLKVSFTSAAYLLKSSFDIAPMTLRQSVPTGSSSKAHSQLAMSFQKSGSGARLIDVCPKLSVSTIDPAKVLDLAARLPARAPVVICTHEFFREVRLGGAWVEPDLQVVGLALVPGLHLLPDLLLALFGRGGGDQVACGIRPGFVGQDLREPAVEVLARLVGRAVRNLLGALTLSHVSHRAWRESYALGEAHSWRHLLLRDERSIGCLRANTGLRPSELRHDVGGLLRAHLGEGEEKVVDLELFHRGVRPLPPQIVGHAENPAWLRWQDLAHADALREINIPRLRQAARHPAGYHLGQLCRI